MVAISVLLPTHSGLPLLKCAVDSILDQSFPDFELIIINDGSDEPTKKYLESLSDLRVVIIHQARQGLTIALNHGISVARGRYIARMDDDDFSFRDRLMIQFAYMEKNPEISVVGCWVEDVSDSDELITVRRPPNDSNKLARQLCWFNPLVHSTLFMRSEEVKHLGCYDEYFKLAQDRDLLLRISERHRIAVVPQILLRYRVRHNGLSMTREKEQKAYAYEAVLRACKRGQFGMFHRLAVMVLRLQLLMPGWLVFLKNLTFRSLGIRR